MSKTYAADFNGFLGAIGEIKIENSAPSRAITKTNSEVLVMAGNRLSRKSSNRGRSYDHPLCCAGVPQSGLGLGRLQSDWSEDDEYMGSWFTDIRDSIVRTGETTAQKAAGTLLQNVVATPTGQQVIQTGVAAGALNAQTTLAQKLVASFNRNKLVYAAGALAAGFLIFRGLRR